MEIMIRSPKLQDYDRFSNIMEQTQALHVDWRPDVYKLTNPFITKEIFQTMIKSGSWYVAEINNMAVGVMELTKRHVESPSKATKDILFIDSIAVDREYRGKGIGRRLFEKAKQIKEESTAIQSNYKSMPKTKRRMKYISTVDLQKSQFIWS